jgi:hypothetical protein
VPELGDHEQRGSVVLLLEQVRGLAELFGEPVEVYGLDKGLIGAVLALLALPVAEVGELVLGSDGGTLSMLRAWFW